jgi:hypothetical protein
VARAFRALAGAKAGRWEREQWVEGALSQSAKRHWDNNLDLVVHVVEMRIFRLAKARKKDFIPAHRITSCSARTNPHWPIFIAR